MCFEVDRADVFVQTTPVARKEHKCMGCWKAIPRGVRYLHVRMIMNGEIITHKECRKCNWKRQQIIDQEIDSGCRSHEADPGYGGYSLSEEVINGEYEFTEPPAEFVIGKRIREVVKKELW